MEGMGLVGTRRGTPFRPVVMEGLFPPQRCQVKGIMSRRYRFR